MNRQQQRSLEQILNDLEQQQKEMSKWVDGYCKAAHKWCNVAMSYMGNQEQKGHRSVSVPADLLNFTRQLN